MNEPGGIAESLKDLKPRILTALAIIDSDVTWELKYGIVFSKKVSAKIFSGMKDIGLSTDYYDPDTSYDEDVLAYKNFLEETLGDIDEILVAIEPTEEQEQ